MLGRSLEFICVYLKPFLKLSRWMITCSQDDTKSWHLMRNLSWAIFLLALMYVPLIKEKLTTEHSDNKMRQLSAFLEGLNGPFGSSSQFMRFLYNYFLYVSGGSFHLITSLSSSPCAIILDRLWNRFNCPLNILQLPSIIAEKAKQCHKTASCFIVSWCKAFPFVRAVFAPRTCSGRARSEQKQTKIFAEKVLSPGQKKHRGMCSRNLLLIVLNFKYFFHRAGYNRIRGTRTILIVSPASAERLVQC